jgi:SAM-dependent methyltransferase
MPRRPQLELWKTAGRITEQQPTGDDVVRTTGWVFNNTIAKDITLEEFVATGDVEVDSYLTVLGLRPEPGTPATLLELGCGIGRMTCAFTREFTSVIGCDVDPGFLERCREAVARFGRPERLRTVQVVDGKSIPLAPNSADCAFSYLTLQHCDPDDALELAAETVRITRPGGKIALNLRSRGAIDLLLLPAGRIARTLTTLPSIGAWLASRRFIARLAWQSNRLAPDEIVGPLSPLLTDVQIWRHPRSKVSAYGASIEAWDGLNPHHYWVVGVVR